MAPTLCVGGSVIIFIEQTIANLSLCVADGNPVDLGGRVHVSEGD